jgi:hypothetical protein
MTSDNNIPADADTTTKQPRRDDYAPYHTFAEFEHGVAAYARGDYSNPYADVGNWPQNPARNMRRFYSLDVQPDLYDGDGELEI